MLAYVSVMRILSLVGVILISATLLAQEELPQQDETEPPDIEPPLLMQTGASLRALAADMPPGETQPERLQTLLERAKQSTAAGERLCRAGIIARVQAEERILKVVRLEADLAAAQLLRAKDEYAISQQRFQAGEMQQAELNRSADTVAAAMEATRNATAKRDHAELQFAETNLHRQQKLLALGSARKADVDRAAEKLARVAQKTD